MTCMMEIKLTNSFVHSRMIPPAVVALSGRSHAKLPQKKVVCDGGNRSIAQTQSARSGQTVWSRLIVVKVYVRLVEKERVQEVVCPA